MSCWLIWRVGKENKKKDGEIHHVFLTFFCFFLDTVTITATATATTTRIYSISQSSSLPFSFLCLLALHSIPPCPFQFPRCRVSLSPNSTSFFFPVSLFWTLLQQCNSSSSSSSSSSAVKKIISSSIPNATIDSVRNSLTQIAYSVGLPLIKWPLFLLLSFVLSFFLSFSSWIISYQTRSPACACACPCMYAMLILLLRVFFSSSSLQILLWAMYMI